MLDFRFHGNDNKVCFLTFYDCIKNNQQFILPDKGYPNNQKFAFGYDRTDKL